MANFNWALQTDRSTDLILDETNHIGKDMNRLTVLPTEADEMPAIKAHMDAVLGKPPEPTR